MIVHRQLTAFRRVIICVQRFRPYPVLKAAASRPAESPRARACMCADHLLWYGLVRDILGIPTPLLGSSTTRDTCVFPTLVFHLPNLSRTSCLLVAPHRFPLRCPSPWARVPAGESLRPLRIPSLGTKTTGAILQALPRRQFRIVFFWAACARPISTTSSK